MEIFNIVVVILAFLSFGFVEASQKFSCESLIYCRGEMLHHIQTAHIFEDSKTFVDMNILHDPQVVIRNFDHLMKVTHGQPTKEDIKQFIEANFQSANELDNWYPPDFNDNPTFMSNIKSIKVKNFAKELVSIWPILGRKVKSVVFKNQNRYSIIPVPNGFIVPGGRFREIYYWDSLWIVKGLLISEMTQTARNMLNNLIHIVKTYGFIPNGSRIYYLDRSQPPVLTLIAADYMEFTSDTSWLKANVDYLEAELLYWLDEKTVDIIKDGKWYTLAHYCADSSAARPRPESYIEDLITAEPYRDPKNKEKLYLELRSGAESGWDFSTRWFFDENGGPNGNLSSIETRRIIPVDLNAFLCKSFWTLKQFYEKLHNPSKARYWKRQARMIQDSIQAILYDPNEGIWYDLDHTLLRHRQQFYPTNLTPLYTNCYDLTRKEEFGRNATRYMNKHHIMSYHGGVPTTLKESHQQWDMPNAWAPLQSLVIFGLENTGDPQALEMARELSMRWLKSNRAAFKSTKIMFEKYNAINPGVFGGGGEYIVQSGFGWSNGVALELIDYYFAKP